jgi:uncharacterized membrane protein
MAKRKMSKAEIKALGLLIILPFVIVGYAVHIIIRFFKFIFNPSIKETKSKINQKPSSPRKQKIQKPKSNPFDITRI